MSPASARQPFDWLLASGAAIIVLAAGASPASAEFLAFQGDNGRTGFVTGQGPERWDIAFFVELPGYGVPDGFPMLVDDTVFVLTTAAAPRYQPTVLQGNATLWRVDLETAEPRAVLDLGRRWFVGGMASDASGVLVVEHILTAENDGGLMLHRLLFEGRQAWAVPLADPRGSAEYGPICTTGVIIEHVYWVACTGSDGWVLYRIDVDSGAVLSSVRDDELFASQPLNPNRPISEPNTDANSIANELAAGSDRVGLAVTVRAAAQGPLVHFFGFDGAYLSTLAPVTPIVQQTVDLSPESRLSSFDPLIKIAADGTLWVINVSGYTALSDGEEIVWQQEWASPNSQTDFVDVGRIAIAAGQAHVAIDGPFSPFLATIDVNDRRVLWPSQPGDALERAQLGQNALLRDGEVLVASTSRDGILIISAADGTLLKTIGPGRIGAPVKSIGIAGGIAVVLAGNDPATGLIYSSAFFDEMPAPAHRVSVIGRVPAGIQLVPKMPESAKPGKPVSMDLTASVPGVMAADIAFSIDWGDGDETRNVSRAEHVYGKAGTFIVQVAATNSAGQEATWSRQVVVQEPRTLLEEAFAQENQEGTFFLLGLTLTLLLAAFSVARLRRRRSRLRKELAAADRISVEERDPDRLRIRLRDQRLQARRLFLAGRLDEGSAGILERHVDELLRGHRLADVEKEFGFLPHHLFRSLQEILGDARVSDWERTQFLILLGQEDSLDSAQKRRVRRRVEQWHRDDAS